MVKWRREGTNEYAPPPEIKYSWPVGTDAVKRFMCVGLALVGNDAVNVLITLRELDNQGTVVFSFFLFGVTMMVIDLRHIVKGGEPLLRTWGMIASRSVHMIRHPRGSYIAIPIAVSGVTTPENKV